MNQQEIICDIYRRFFEGWNEDDNGLMSQQDFDDYFWEEMERLNSGHPCAANDLYQFFAVENPDKDDDWLYANFEDLAENALIAYWESWEEDNLEI